MFNDCIIAVAPAEPGTYLVWHNTIFRVIHWRTPDDGTVYSSCV